MSRDEIQETNARDDAGGLLRAGGAVTGNGIYTKAERERMERDGTALIKAKNQPAEQLLTVEKAQQFLAQCRNVDEVKDMADKAKAVAMYLRVSRASLGSQNDAIEIQLRAQRRAAQLQDQLPKAAGTRGQRFSRRGTGGPQSGPPVPTLADQGIGKRELHQWRKLAAIQDKKFDELIESARSQGQRVAAKAITQAVKVEKQSAARYRKETEAKAAPERALVRLADQSELLASVDDQTVDLLITDPPYSTDVDNIDTFAEWLTAALRKLKPTGRAYVCIGAYPAELLAYLSVVRDAGWLDRSQVLVWTYRNTLGPSPSHDYKLNWQAILYMRGVDAPPLDCPIMTEQFSVQDINAPDGRLGDRYHAWQKPDELAERLVRHASKPGDLVIDPFACTGSFLLAAARLGRRAIGCDISSENLEIAVQRGCLLEGSC